MNCRYRILKEVHIGLRVRKTKDKTTVPYKNEPITDVYISEWNRQGFALKHEAFPTKTGTIWLDFDQLPINTLNIEMGFIKNPIVFVESIITYGGITSMAFIRADTFDYLELLKDHEYKIESERIKPTQLKAGDQVISCICRDSHVMIFLGRFRLATKTKRFDYGRGFEKGNYVDEVTEAPEHAVFAYPQSNGKYNAVSYPLTNKYISELYKAEDKGKLFDETCFNDEVENQRFLQEVFISRDRVERSIGYLKSENNPIQRAGTRGNSYDWKPVYVGKGSLNKAETLKLAKQFFNIDY